MDPDTPPDPRRTSRSARVRAVRVSSGRALLGPGLAAAYLLATPDRANRPEMLLIAALMLAAAATTWQAAPLIARSRPVRLATQSAGMLINIAGSSTLSLLDGGIHSPLGAMIPFSLLFYAIMMPPRAFALASVLSAGAYWAVALVGDPAPRGYAVVYTLGVGGVAFLCFRHAAVLASLRHRLADASRTDPLTRSLNRRGFDERLDRAVAEANRTGLPVTLILADLDRFKAVNDTHGHQAGDDVLAWTARTMATALRRQDVLGRLGGDEFGAVLTGTGPEDARAITDRVRDAVHEAVPASFGYATCPDEATTVDGLLRLADERAYADKMNRRQVPPVEPEVGRARAEVEPPAPREVARTERRRRSIADTGKLCLSDCAVGLVWVTAFAGGHRHRPLIALLLVAGLAYGLVMMSLADRIARSHRARAAVIGGLLFPFALALGIPVLGGGVDSALGLGILAPMPLVALLAPPRVAVPVLSVTVASYTTTALFVGDPDPWYWVMHLIGMVLVAVACFRQGRAAARQRTLLTTLSQTDALTGSLNRRGFTERFAAALAAAARDDTPLSLLVFDLDGFKQLNDTAGHAAGDELLRWTAARLAAGPDPVGRLGGDEFVVLGPRPAGEARAVAERLRAALAERVPASVGVAALGLHGTGFAELYAHADAELYREKAARARAVAATPRGSGCPA